MIKLTETLEEMRGEYVEIYTKHRFFGSQHIQMKFDPETEIGYGFHCKEQTIYIREDEIVDYVVGDNEIIINGKDMEIKIAKRA